MFPIERIQPKKSTLTGLADDLAIELQLEVFDLDGEKIDTSIRLEGIQLPTNQLDEMIGRRFEFPVNPEDGYIDGSVYIDHVHHPIDVTSIAFQDDNAGQTMVIIDLKFVFSFEGLNNYGDVSTQLVIPIRSS